jgi:hypothetical protein
MRHLYLLLLFFSCAAMAQTETPTGFAVEANYFYGNIIPHRKGMMHLILGHPEGMVLSINKNLWHPRMGVGIQLSRIRRIVPLSGHEK